MTDYMDPDPEMDDAMLMRLQYDLAIGIHTPEELAQRYGFSDSADLQAYFARRPSLISATAKMKALFESDEGTETRVRAKAMLAAEKLIPPVARIAGNPHVAPQQRIDAFKQLSRVGGLDGSAAALAAKAGQGGTPFTLNIMFRNHPSERLELVADAPEEYLSPQTQERSPRPSAPAARGLLPLADDDDGEWDDEV